MTADEIKNIAMCGETSTKQFKLFFNKAEDIANELVAFANSQGGDIFIGIDDKTGEIPEVALSELLQNSLTHRSWLKPAPIRLLIFDDRVEIISPGCLPNNLTVEDIKFGNAFQRNQLIANLCAKTMDYRGLGSGIIRALKADANIEFRNEASGDQFRAILWRNEQKTTQEAEGREETTQESNLKIEGSEKTTQKTTQNSNLKEGELEKTTQNSNLKEGELEKTTLKSNLKEGDPEKTEQKSSLKSDQKIIEYLKENGNLTIPDLQNLIGLSRSGVKKILTHLKESGKIRRVGPDKGGHWDVCE